MEILVNNGSETKGISKIDFIFIVFGSLDGLAFLLALPMIFRLSISLFSHISSSIIYVTSIFLLALLLSYAISAYGIIKRRTWGFILYYCQFPLRLGFCSGSLGFLYKINVLLGSPAPYYIFGILILLGEVARLVVTLVLRKRLRNDNKLEICSP